MAYQRPALGAVWRGSESPCDPQPATVKTMAARSGSRLLPKFTRTPFSPKQFELHTGRPTTITDAISFLVAPWPARNRRKRRVRDVVGLIHLLRPGLASVRHASVTLPISFGVGRRRLMMSDRPSSEHVPRRCPLGSGRIWSTTFHDGCAWRNDLDLLGADRRGSDVVILAVVAESHHRIVTSTHSRKPPTRGWGTATGGVRTGYLCTG